MALSNELISMFAKATNDSKKQDTAKSVNGTVVEFNGHKYVKMDGSELLTPIETVTEISDGDRVKVEVKNHTATVTGNISSPSVGMGVVSPILTSVQSLTAEQIRVTGLLEAAEADITDLKADTAKIGKLEADVANIGTVVASKVDADYVEANFATIGNLNATNASLYNLSSTYGAFASLTTNKFTAVDADISKINADNVNINEKLTAQEAVIESLDTTYATIDFANIKMEAVEKLFADSGIIKDLVVEQGKITGELIGVTIKGDLIEGNTIKADKLVVRGEDGIYYKLNMDSLGPMVVEADPKYQNGLDGSVILAKSIVAEQIDVKDLVAFRAKIGGSNISDHAIYSGVKESINNTTPGFYMNDEGEWCVGDAESFIKFAKDENNVFKLTMKAQEIVTEIVDEVSKDASFTEKITQTATGIATTISQTTIQQAIPGIESSVASGILDGIGLDNILYYPYYYKDFSVRGITFTDLGDGTISASGTVNAGSDAYFPHINYDGVIPIKANTWYTLQLADMPNYCFIFGEFREIASTSTKSMTFDLKYGDNETIVKRTNSNFSLNYSSVFYDRVRFRVPEEVRLTIQSRVQKEKTVNNAIFKPMLFEGEKKASTFIPFKYTQDNIVNSSADNLLPYPYFRDNGYTYNGITYTINDDNSVTANGTATANSTFHFKVRGTDSNNGFLLSTGEYSLSGCPRYTRNEEVGKFYLVVNGYFGEDNTNINYAFDYGSGARFRITDDILPKNERYMGCCIEIKSGYTANNLTFYPKINKGVVIYPYSQYGVSAEAIKNDLSQNYASNSTMQTSIESAINDVNDTLEHNYVNSNDFETFKSETSTQFEQTSSSFEFQFNEMLTKINNQGETTEQEFEDIRRYIRFENGNIILGESNNELTLTISNDRISFMQNESEVAYFASNRLYVVDGEFTNTLQLGNFAFIPRASGNLSFRKVGG